MADTSFYKDHWVQIDDERLQRYQQMFEWNPESAALYEPADIQPGHVVAEFGCGPGHTAIEIATGLVPAAMFTPWISTKNLSPPQPDHAPVPPVSPPRSAHGWFHAQLTLVVQLSDKHLQIVDRPGKPVDPRHR
jgi:hypothetical protein